MILLNWLFMIFIAWFLFSYINSSENRISVLFILGNFLIAAARVYQAGAPHNPVRKPLSGRWEGEGDPPILPLQPDKSFASPDKSVCNLFISVNTFLSIPCQFVITPFLPWLSRVKRYMSSLCQFPVNLYNNTWQTIRQEQTRLSRGLIDYQTIDDRRACPCLITCQALNCQVYVNHYNKAWQQKSQH